MPRRDETAAARALSWGVVVVVATVFAVVRLQLGEEYRHAPWDALLEGTAPRPFGHRVLMPWLARGLVAATSMSTKAAFTALEAASAAGLLVALRAALRTRRAPGPALGLAVGGVVVVGIALVVPRQWPIFYPWDTPAIAAVVAAVALAQRRRHGWLVFLAMVAALNRESALLIPLVLVALRISDEPDRRGLWAWVAAGIGVVVLVRVGIELVRPDNPGPPLHFTVHGGYRVHENLAWLGDAGHVLQALAWGGWLLLVWPWRARVAGWPWRRLGAVASLWLATAMVVANVYEPRAFGETVALGWLVVVAGPPHAASRRTPALRWFDVVSAWGPWLLLAAIAVSLHHWAWLPIAQWPMPK
jgi:hypothetical protein